MVLIAGHKQVGRFHSPIFPLGAKGIRRAAPAAPAVCGPAARCEAKSSVVIPVALSSRTF